MRHVLGVEREGCPYRALTRCPTDELLAGVGGRCSAKSLKAASRDPEQTTEFSVAAAEEEHCTLFAGGARRRRRGVLGRGGGAIRQGRGGQRRGERGPGAAVQGEEEAPAVREADTVRVEEGLRGDEAEGPRALREGGGGGAPGRPTVSGAGAAGSLRLGRVAPPAMNRGH